MSMTQKIPVSNVKKYTNPIAKTKNISKESPITLDFENFMFNSISCGIFTNFHQDELECLRVQKNFFNKFLPHISGKTFEELSRESKHNHIIDSDRSKSNVNLINIVLKFYSEKFGFLDLSDKEYTLWQLTASSGMRVIGFRNRDTFKLLFLDPHHLIFKNETFNNDYKNYACTGENISYSAFNLVNIDDEFLNNCCNCHTFLKFIEK